MKGTGIMSPKKSPTKEDALVVEVFHPYRAQEKHQLTIAAGEKLTVIEKDPSGWWVGRNAKNVVGVFPSTYTRKVTPQAPPAEFTRELAAARIAAELGILKSKSVCPSATSSLVLDLDYDDVYSMSRRELESEIKSIMTQKEQYHRKLAEAMERVVDEVMLKDKKARGIDAPKLSMGSSTVAQQDDEDASDGFALQQDRQRIAIGRRRLEELVTAEKELRAEHSDLLEHLKKRGIPAPAILGDLDAPASAAATPRESQKTTTLAGQTFHQNPRPVNGAACDAPTDGDGDPDWPGITSRTCIRYCKKLQSQFDAENEFLDRLEARLEDLAKQAKRLENQMEQTRAELEEKAAAHDKEVERFIDGFRVKAEQAKAEYEGLKSGAISGPALVQSLKENVDHLNRQLEVAKRDYSKKEHEAELLRAKLKEVGAMAQLKTQAEDLRKQTNALRLQEQEAAQHIDVTLEQHKKDTEQDAIAYKKLERRRREIYNQIQELKGNLRVYCRIKPPAKGETNECIQVLDDMTLHVTDPETFRESEHEFDLVIPEKSTQEEIFEEVRPLATSVLDGYNVCIFAYGQTGSGKTYTMEGPPNNRGINYRAVRELFSVAGERGDDYNFTLSVSILEVYNDKLFDLQNKRCPCKVRWGGPEAGVVIEPIVKHAVCSVDDVQAALEKAYLSRSVAGTDCNAHSSRSHCILTVYVQAFNTATQSSITGKLHLIDLAGSERIKHSHVEGDRLKEATHINTSLTHLKTVINGLANKTSHVAYRNSTLTAMLQDSLGGNCKCLMFANVSPATHNIPESICTLKYAAEARKVEVGKVSANVKKIEKVK
jgi:kinesin family protein C2/C3